MNLSDIKKELLKSKDDKYKDFQASLIPTIDKKYFIGVRTPRLKEISKLVIKEGLKDKYLKELPHKYFDENQIHAFIISDIKDYDLLIKEINKFLPYVDNWATCDQLCPKALSKYKKELIKEINKWIKSKKTYSIRFSIKMLMTHYLSDDSFDEKYLKMVSSVKSKEYYVNMMKAWYFATALAKKYDSAIKYIENKTLDTWTHNKAISKAIESYRLSDKNKKYLRTLKINN